MSDESTTAEERAGILAECDAWDYYVEQHGMVMQGRNGRMGNARDCSFSLAPERMRRLIDHVERLDEERDELVILKADAELNTLAAEAQLGEAEKIVADIVEADECWHQKAAEEGDYDGVGPHSDECDGPLGCDDPCRLCLGVRFLAGPEKRDGDE